jgi:hypothetical protein
VRADVAPVSGQRRLLESKLQPAVLTALDCFRKSTKSQTPCANVNSGKVTLQMWLTEDSPLVRAQLQALGFTLTKGNARAKMVIGVLALEKLEDVVKLPSVRFVSFERR